MEWGHENTHTMFLLVNVQVGRKERFKGCCSAPLGFFCCFFGYANGMHFFFGSTPLFKSVPVDLCTYSLLQAA